MLFRFERLLASVLFLGLISATPALAALEQGKQYTLVSPAQPTEAGKNIEVLEFFSYACPHCYNLEPVLSPWAKKQPPDVSFRYLPAVFSDKWLIYSRIYYAAEALSLLDKLHLAIFRATHDEHLDLSNEGTLKTWLGKQGVDAKKFLEAYASFAVMTKANRAKQLTKAYAITGVPAVAIDGRYLTSASQAGGNEQLLPVLDELIRKARTERPAK